MTAAWVLLLILKNPGDAHGTSQRIAMPTAATCQAGKAQALTTNARLRAAGYGQEMVAVCVEQRS